MYFGRKGLAVVFIVYGHQGGDEGENHEEDHHDGVGDLKKGNVEIRKRKERKDNLVKGLAMVLIPLQIMNNKHNDGKLNVGQPRRDPLDE